MNDDYDSPWKSVLEHYFSDFMAFFFPLAHAEINWQKGYTFLDKELEKIVRDAALGRRLVDKLIQVTRQDGQQERVLVHVEVQAQTEAQFAERMYIYHSRLFDRYKRRVASFAVLADEDPNWRPQRFHYALWGSELSLTFATVKLIDYAPSSLQASHNPFAWITLAHSQTQATKGNPTERYRWKWRLTRTLYERGLAKRDLLELFCFLDWIMALPEELQTQYNETVQHYEEQAKMNYVTSIEKVAEKKGLEQGLEQGLQAGRHMLMRLLEKRFGVLQPEIRNKIEQAEPKDLEHWSDVLLEAAQLKDVFH